MSLGGSIPLLYRHILERLTPRRRALLLSAALTALVLLVSSLEPRWLVDIDNLLLDLKFRLRPAQAADPRVAIVAVDERTLEAFGRWPFPRQETARLLQALHQQGAAVIALDVLYADKDSSASSAQASASRLYESYQWLGLDSEQPEAIAAALAELERQEKALLSLEPQGELSTAATRLSEARARLRQRWERLAAASSEFLLQLQEQAGAVDADERVAEALRTHGHTVLGHVFFMERLAQGESFSERQARDEEGLASSALATPLPPEAEPLFPVRAWGAQANLPELSEAAHSQGFLNVFQDGDGAVRSTRLVLPYNSRLYPALALQAHSAWLERQERDGRITLELGPRGIARLAVGGEAIPVTPQGTLLLNYLGPSHTLRHYSWVDVVDGRLPEGALQGALVFVGVTDKAGGDHWVTPVDEQLSGVELHATLAHGLLTRQHLLTPPWRKQLELAAVLVCGVLATWLLLTLRPGRSVAALLLLLLATHAASLALFSWGGVHLSPLLPTLELGLVGFGLVLYRYLTEERQKRLIQGAFGQYLSPHVIEQILADPSRLKLGGEERVCTAFFSDLAGFSSFSERLPPAELVRLLNEYLTEMTEVLHAQGGTVDKYLGDGVAAFFGAPLPYGDHAVRACVAAIHQQRRLAVLRERWQAEGRPLLHARMGLNTGPMLIGNMGSASRLSYTMMGDAVNLAARLEGANKSFGTRILISESTWEAARHAVEGREVDMLRVVGRAQPLRVYEVLEEKGHLDPALQPVLEHFARGLTLYRERRFAEAREAFQAALALREEDGPSRAYVQRCEAFLASPPPADWDGVYALTEK